MTVRIEATARPDGTIELALSDAEASANIRLDLHEVMALYLVLGEALQQIPSNRKSELADLPPALRGRPRYELASSPDGELVLTFQLGPLPPFQFLIDDDRARTLCDQIDLVLKIPRHARYPSDPS